MKTSSRDQLFEARAILFDVSTELRALAYLFETQGSKVNQFPENDMDLISHGLGRLIKRQVRCIHKASAALDKA